MFLEEKTHHTIFNIVTNYTKMFLEEKKHQQKAISVEPWLVESKSGGVLTSMIPFLIWELLFHTVCPASSRLSR